MDLLKKLSFPSLVAAVGVVVLVAGLASEFSLGELSLKVGDGWPRLGMGVLGLGLLALAGVTWLRGDRSQAGAVSSRSNGDGAARVAGATLLSAVPGSFLFTLDDRSDASFPAVVRESDRVSILGRTAVNVAANYSQVLRDVITNRSCEVRIVLLDPACPAASYVYGSKPAIYRRNLAQAVEHLASLSLDVERAGHGRPPMLRTMDELPPFSMLIAEKPDRDRSAVHVQLNFLYTRIGRDRPMFTLNRHDPWFERFIEEFEAIWRHHSQEVSLDELQRSVAELERQSRHG